MAPTKNSHSIEGIFWVLWLLSNICERIFIVGCPTKECLTNYEVRDDLYVVGHGDIDVVLEILRLWEESCVKKIV